MTKAGESLADYMIGGVILSGHYKMKWLLILIHSLIQIALCLILFFYAGKIKGIIVLFLALGITGGLLIWIAIVFWLGRAFRVHRSIKMLGHTMAEKALQELLENGKNQFTPKDVIFSKHFAFFFKSGSIAAYENIRQLYIVRTKAPSTKFLLWNRDLMAEMTKGKWLLLAREKVFGSKPKTNDILRKYIESIIGHNTGIIIKTADT